MGTERLILCAIWDVPFAHRNSLFFAGLYFYVQFGTFLLHIRRVWDDGVPMDNVTHGPQGAWYGSESNGEKKRAGEEISQAEAGGQEAVAVLYPPSAEEACL